MSKYFTRKQVNLDDGIMNRDECPCCFELTDEKVQPCSHTLCRKCAYQYYVIQRKNDCMLCRGPIVMHPSSNERNCMSLRVYLKHGKHAGISLVSHPHGVRINRLHKGDKAYLCGLRENDVITHINDIFIKTPGEGTRIINICTERSIDFSCKLKSNRCCFRTCLI